LEKRLLLAITLSVAVLVLWQWVFPPPPPAEPTTTPAAASGVSAPSAAPSAPEKPQPPPISSVLVEDAERTLEIDLGQPGEVGAYRAVFSNRGARLVELKLKSYVDRVGLSDAERLEPEHWIQLVRSVESSGALSGSLLLRSDVSSRDLEREPLERALWTMKPWPDANAPRGVEFELAQGSGLRLVKRAHFEPGTYRLRVELELHNDALAGERALGFLFSPAEVMPLESGDTFYVEPQSIAAGRTAEGVRNRDSTAPKLAAQQRDDSGGPTSGPLEVPADELSFAGVHNKFFAMLLRGADANATATLRGARWRRMADDELARAKPALSGANWSFMATDVVLELRAPAVGESRKYEYIIYAGPKQSQMLVDDFADHQALLEYDRSGTCCVPVPFVTSIANGLTWLLAMLHKLTGNWGAAIILMTILVRLALFPATRKSQTAMARFQKKMKRLQPQIDELKRKFEGDPAKQREAQQKMMLEHGMTPPLGGCLPMFVQVPIFFGLFSALRTDFELRQQPFLLWMSDLSKPDRLLELGWQIPLPFTDAPFVIEHLNLLPLLMVVLWVAQQALMPKPTDEQQAQMQKMMMFMPIVMGFALYNYAAGLSLYMITQSGIGILENTVVKKIWPIDDSEPPPSQKKEGFLQSMMRRAAQMQQDRDGKDRDGKDRDGKDRGRDGGRGGKNGKRS
jgi:YidC/Oxa1 family membrane protein insertase